MKKTIMTVLDICELEREICRRLNKNDIDLREVLFDTNFQNDCCKYCDTLIIEENLCGVMDEEIRAIHEELLKIFKAEGIEGDFLIDVSW